MKTLPSEGRSRKILLTLLITVLSAFVVYQSYLVFFDSPTGKNSATAAVRDSTARGRQSLVVQIDVLNGSGVSGVAQKMTSFARSMGYDVVEMRNYKTPDVKETLVIDRCGNMEMAKRIAADIGVKERNILQQLNPDYFVTASIVVGKDYKDLPAWIHSKK
ncbi:MAG: LytR C-terminal domain-containing protein [Ignavibacteriales bacterium]|nr:LytR C-terminal domain-containing protein [Ignavibacteriales bacterium]